MNILTILEEKFQNQGVKGGKTLHRQIPRPREGLKSHAFPLKPYDLRSFKSMIDNQLKIIKWSNISNLVFEHK